LRYLHKSVRSPATPGKFLLKPSVEFAVPEFAVAGVLKYAVKPSDMVRDHDWFLILVDRLHNTKAVAIGGLLKHYIKEREREDLTREPGEEEQTEGKEQLFSGWKQEVRRYRKVVSHGTQNASSNT